VQVKEMVKELQEKGEGQEELAEAHAHWQSGQDDAALQRLKRCLKYGFSKGRKRVGEVCARLDAWLLRCVIVRYVRVGAPG
jgi:hypothetical protein